MLPIVARRYGQTPSQAAASYVDSIQSTFSVKHATRALIARDWFANQKPADAPELPLTYKDREELKGGDPLSYIVSLFARSLAPEYEIARHLGFDRYARGVMASPHTPPWIRQDAEMLRRYPPAPLAGLGGGLIRHKT
jgi:hypothetical protein